MLRVLCPSIVEVKACLQDYSGGHCLGRHRQLSGRAAVRVTGLMSLRSMMRL